MPRRANAASLPCPGHAVSLMIDIVSFPFDLHI